MGIPNEAAPKQRTARVPLVLLSLAMLWIPGSIAALLVFLALIGFRVRARRRAARLGQVDAKLQHASREHSSQLPAQTREIEIASQPSSPDLPLSKLISQSDAVLARSALPAPSSHPTECTSSTLPTNVDTSSSYEIREASRSSFHRLVTVAKQVDADIFLPLKDALIELVELGDSMKVCLHFLWELKRALIDIKRPEWPVDGLEAFRSSVEAFTASATITAANNDAEADGMLNYLQSIVE